VVWFSDPNRLCRCGFEYTRQRLISKEFNFEADQIGECSLRLCWKPKRSI
jgi:hypothetical protein